MKILSPLFRVIQTGTMRCVKCGCIRIELHFFQTFLQLLIILLLLMLISGCQFSASQHVFAFGVVSAFNHK